MCWKSSSRPSSVPRNNRSVRSGRCFGRRAIMHGNQPAKVQPASNSNDQIPRRTLQLPNGRKWRHFPNPVPFDHLRSQHRPERSEYFGPSRTPFPTPTGLHSAGNLWPVLQQWFKQKETRLFPHLLSKLLLDEVLSSCLECWQCFSCQCHLHV